jgi:glutathione peroxidase
LQEPGANASEILAVLKYIRPGDGFVPNFDMFAKSEVNGDKENPIYTFLKGRCHPAVLDFVPKAKLFYDPLHSDDIRWNFAKFLVNKKGQPLARYPEFMDPLDMTPHIDTLLGCI